MAITLRMEYFELNLSLVALFILSLDSSVALEKDPKSNILMAS